MSAPPRMTFITLSWSDSPRTSSAVRPSDRAQMMSGTGVRGPTVKLSEKSCASSVYLAKGSVVTATTTRTLPATRSAVSTRGVVNTWLGVMREFGGLAHFCTTRDQRLFLDEGADSIS